MYKTTKYSIKLTCAPILTRFLKFIGKFIKNEVNLSHYNLHLLYHIMSSCISLLELLHLCGCNEVTFKKNIIQQGLTILLEKYNKSFKGNHALIVGLRRLMTVV